MRWSHTTQRQSISPSTRGGRSTRVAEAGSLVDLHFGALYGLDDGGRVVGREPSPPGPRFHLFRTAEANYCVVAADIPEGLARELREVLAAEPVVADLERVAPDIEAVRRLLATERAPANEYRGPAFVFPEELPATVGVKFITNADDPRIRRSFSWLADELDDVQPAAAIIVDGAIASLCCSVPGADAVEASLNTDEAHRGRGVWRFGDGGLGTGCAPVWPRTSVQHLLGERGIEGRGGEARP